MKDRKTAIPTRTGSRESSRNEGAARSRSHPKQLQKWRKRARTRGAETGGGAGRAAPHGHQGRVSAIVRDGKAQVEKLALHWGKIKERSIKNTKSLVVGCQVSGILSL